MLLKARAANALHNHCFHSKQQWYLLCCVLLLIQTRTAQMLLALNSKAIYCAVLLHCFGAKTELFEEN
jgi:hypothetical protein